MGAKGDFLINGRFLQKLSESRILDLMNFINLKNFTNLNKKADEMSHQLF